MSQASLPRFLYRRGVPLWRDVVVLQWAAQIVSAIAVVAFLVFFVRNVLDAAESRGLGLGYGFLDDAAGFPLPESVLEYDPSRPFGYAFLIGLLHTLRVSLVGVVLATLVGVVAALADELAASPRLADKETFRALAARVRQRTGQKGRSLFHPMRVALTGEGSGIELDIAVPAIERAADLPPGSGLAPVAGCRERSARVAALLREAASPAGH